MTTSYSPVRSSRPDQKSSNYDSVSPLVSINTAASSNYKDAALDSHQYDTACPYPFEIEQQSGEEHDGNNASSEGFGQPRTAEIGQNAGAMAFLDTNNSFNVLNDKQIESLADFDRR